MDNKENVLNDEKKNRSRGENWSQEEKDLFLEIMQVSAPIVESKLTDTNSNKRKNLEWVKIQSKLRELTGKQREIGQLKGFWRRSKIAAKKSVSQHRKALRATGGGQAPPSPPPIDMKILELCPTDFVVDENIYDSDAVSQSKDNTEIIIDNDIEEIINSELEGTYVDEVITIADVHHNEDDISDSGHFVKQDTKKVIPLKEDKDEGMTPKSKKKFTGKAAVIEGNVEFKQRTLTLMEEEYKLKMTYLKRDLSHQEFRHKMEIDLLLLQKEKALLEIELLKKQLNRD